MKKLFLLFALILTFVCSNVKAQTTPNGIYYFNGTTWVSDFRDPSILAKAGDTILMEAIVNDTVRKSIWTANYSTIDTTKILKYVFDTTITNAKAINVFDTTSTPYNKVYSQMVYAKFSTPNYVFKMNNEKSTEVKLTLSDFNIKINTQVWQSTVTIDTIFWYNNDVLVHSGKDTTFTPTENGDYNIKIKTIYNNVYNGKSSLFTRYEVSKKLTVSTITTTGIKENEEKSKIELTVFPNPTTDVLNISKVVEFHIFSITGQEVLNGIDNKVDVSNLTNGVYFLKTVNGEMKKFVKN